MSMCARACVRVCVCIPVCARASMRVCGGGACVCMRVQPALVGAELGAPAHSRFPLWRRPLVVTENIAP